MDDHLLERVELPPEIAPDGRGHRRLLSRRPLRRLAVAVLGLVACLLALHEAPASGHDPLAPAGSPHSWLPEEPWVTHHWLPFDDSRLLRLLRLRPGELEAYLYNDHNTLATLARRRGLDVEHLADALTADWAPTADAAELQVLRDRTARVLTQGHLAQHMFFHTFHGAYVAHRDLNPFAIAPDAFWAMRRRRLSPLEIGRSAGVSDDAVRVGMLAALARQRDDGVRGGGSWPASADRFHARQVAQLACWLTSPPPGSDPGNPYGRAYNLHKPHEPTWPATSLDRRRNARAVERTRRAVPASCWGRPTAWRTALTATRGAVVFSRQARPGGRHPICRLGADARRAARPARP